MEFHRGRLIDHVHLRVINLDASKRFSAESVVVRPRTIRATR